MTGSDWDARRIAFGHQADAYAFGRPSYPDEAVGWVLPDGARVALDLAAGTGRLTERLLARGLDVIAVEPLAEMRAHIPTAATTMAGTAEQIPVDDGAVDCVVVGQAFHWFDGPAAMAEIRRVLRPGGTVGLLWNLADDSDPFVGQLAAAVGPDEITASSLDPDQAPPYVDIDGMTVPERRFFRSSDDYDVERLTALVLSMSQTVLMSPEDRIARLEQVRSVAPAELFAFPHVCEVWRGERRD